MISETYSGAAPEEAPEPPVDPEPLPRELLITSDAL